MTSVGGPDARPQPEQAAPEPAHAVPQAGPAVREPGEAAPQSAHAPHPGPEGYPYPAGAQGGQPGDPAAWAAAYQAPQPDRFSLFVARLYDRAPRWAVPLAALGCIGAAVAYTLVADPTQSSADARPSCLLKLTTGFTCPGCGGTRAAWYLLHGDLGAAARHHLLFVFAVPFLIYMYVAWAGRTAFGWRLPQLQLSPKVLGLFLAAWGVFTVVRNLPWEPFTLFQV